MVVEDKAVEDKAVDDSAAVAADEAPISRQAIVVVHGQGQQRPMGTIRDVVRTLWSYSPEFGELTEDERRDGRKAWIVPDDKSSLYELQRITTPEHGGRRTDFFELYYADLLDDTPIRNLWRWSQRLLWIDRRDVTKRMRWPWTLFWALNLVVFGIFVAFLLRLPELFRGSWTAPLLAPEAMPALAVIAIAMLVLLLPKFATWLTWLARVPPLVSVLVIAVAIVFIYWPSPESEREVPAVLLLLLLAGCGYLIFAVLLPLFGDAASYLSAQTETVGSREAVRRRGIDMLRKLHDDPDYDRIVVVAHSLGTVLAYDLLHILWRDVGPTRDNPPSPAALEALRAVDAHTAAMGDAAVWPPNEVSLHQDLQWRAFEALRREKGVEPASAEGMLTCGWKISDFVSLGSPLASAQFLVTEGRKDFARMKKERVLPTAPPDPYEEGELAVHDADGIGYLHHAAVFSTVRWTNLHDDFHPLVVVFGDVISGPLADQFGPAILDVPVTIKRGGITGRFFTHNHYWVDGKDPTQPLAHVVSLRKAVGMRRGEGSRAG